MKKIFHMGKVYVSTGGSMLKKNILTLVKTARNTLFRAIAMEEREKTSGN